MSQASLLPLLLFAPLGAGDASTVEIGGGMAGSSWPQVAGTAADAPPAAAPGSSLARRPAVASLEFAPISFDPPAPDEHEIHGVPVLHLHDPLLPLVDVQVQLIGGPGNFPRERLAAVSAFPFVLRAGGTRELPPDAVDRTLDLLALQLSVSAGGGGTSLRLNALEEQLEPALALLADLLIEPRMEAGALEVWRGQARERIRRREDNPPGLAFSEFNRLMYGDHPVGWVMQEGDLAEDRLNSAALRELHAVLVCRDRLLLGISGDITWERAEPLLRAFLDPWPECAGPLPPSPEPAIRRGPGIFILPEEIDQSTVILGQPTAVRQQDSPEYFAAQIANHLLGGSGFGSRMMERIRTERGLAYGASSVWTTPLRHEGLLGAVTATGAETTLEALRLLLEVLEEFRDSPPTEAEIRAAVQEITTGYVFAFESAAQIVARQMLYRAQGLPGDWLWRYWDGLQEVTARTIAEVVHAHLDPSRMTVLLLGDPARFRLNPGLHGPVYELLPDGGYRPWVNRAAPPDGGPRSRP